jgi:GNAT superfamily N-acetyltransferase
MIPRYILRSATPADTDAVSSVLQAAAHRLIERGDGMWSLATLAPAHVRADITDYRLALAEGEIVGVVKVQSSDPRFWPDIGGDDSLFLHRLAVIPSFAEKGVSRVLIGCVIDEARRQERRYVRLDCAADRPKLRAVYERAGFRRHSDIHIEGFHLSRYQYEV